MTTFSKTRLVITVAAVAIVGLSCNRPSTIETEVRSVALTVDEPAKAYSPSLEGPLRIVSASPSGLMKMLRPGQQVSITFSRAMVALGGETTPDPNLLSIVPNIEGTWRWSGSQTLLFEPQGQFDLATEYSVSINPGFQSLDSETFEKEFTWTFTTPLPTAKSLYPSNGQSHVDPSKPIVVEFNQPVELASFVEAVSLTAGRRSLEFQVSEIESGTLFHLEPTPYPLNSRCVLQIGAGIKGREGVLTSAAQQQIVFRTYGPLQLAGVSQGYLDQDDLFRPEGSVILNFTNAVSRSDLLDHLTITPEVEIIDIDDSSRPSQAHTIRGYWKPSTRYTFRIRDLEDVYGQRLSNRAQSIRFDELRPTANIPSGMLVVESKEQPAIPIYVTNLEEIETGVQRLGTDQIIPSLQQYDQGRYYDGLTLDNPPDVDLISRAVSGSEERQQIMKFSFDEALNDGAGVLLARLNVAKQGTLTRAIDKRAVVQVTNLGLTAKFSPHQSLVFVATLDDATPVGGATAEFRNADNEVVWTGTSNSDGLVVAPGWVDLELGRTDEWSNPLQFVIVEKDGDVAFTSSEYDSGLEPYRFGIYGSWSQQELGVAASIFTDRGLYKAGETVQIKGIVRTRTDGDWVIEQDSIRTTISSPRGDEVYDQVHSLGDFGSFAFDWSSPANAEQGAYYINMTHVASGNRAGGGTFRIDAFRTSTFAVDARSSSTQYIAGDIFEGSVEGRYLFGAPMVEQPVKYSIYRQSGNYSPPGFEDYRFSFYSWSRSTRAYKTLAQGDSTLDSDGLIQISAQLPTDDYSRPAQIILEGSVTDPARQTLSGRASSIVHPASFYVGLKPRTTFVQLADGPQALEVDVVAVDPAGASIAETEIKLSLIRRQWNSVREIGSDGRLRWRSEVTEELIDSTKVTSQRRRAARVTMKVEKAGSYIVRADAIDVRGNSVRTEAYFYASGRDYVAWDRRDDVRIDLVTDKSSYRPGETARILVQSPYEEATALITVERDGIMSSRIEKLVGSAPQINVDLTTDHLPNAFVSVILLSGRTARPTNAADIGAPSFKIGYVELPVDAGTRRLTVSVTPDKVKYEPGEEVSVEIDVRDSKGKGIPAEVSFSAADAGVLNLIGYTLPDPFSNFYRPRPLNVATTETRSNIVKQRSFGQKEFDRGGGGDGDQNDQTRTDFRPSAHWDPSIRTDARGRATVKFKLPESLTTFRLMATAATQSHSFGSSRTDVVVTKPLVSIQALPRFARIGDRFEAGIVVTNTTGIDGEVNVTAEADGFELVGLKSKTVFIEDGKSREVRFSWTAPAFGTASVKFVSTLGEFEDALQVPVPVALPTSTIAFGTFASTESSAAEAIDLPDDRLRDLDDFSIRLSSTALVGLDGATNYLFQYPYGCLEQRTSRIRPLLLGENVLAAFDLDALDGDRDEVVNEWIAELTQFWTGDGFALWKGQHHVSPYASVYATTAMLEAQTAGYEVPEQLLNQALDYLERITRNSDAKPNYYNEFVWGTTRATALLTLAKSGRSLESEVAALAEKSLVDGDIETIALLYRTIALIGSNVLDLLQPQLERKLNELIVVEPTVAWATRPDDTGYYWIFGSDTRTTATVLAALSEASVNPDLRPIAEKMVRYLLQQRRSRSWQSTQENAAVVSAFAAFFERFETVEPDFTARVNAAGAEIIQQVFRGRNLQVVHQDIPTSTSGSDVIPLEISKSGEGQLYYSILAQGYTTRVLDRQNNGLQVERTIQRLDDFGNAVGRPHSTDSGEYSLLAGELVKVTLTLSSPADRNYVVVDDPLPAGLEALNSAFETTSNQATRNTGRTRWWGSFNHAEIKDDRVLLFADYLQRGEHTYSYIARGTTPGSYTLPPTQSELMYQPSVNGRTGTSTLTVTAPPEATSGN